MLYTLIGVVLPEPTVFGGVNRDLTRATVFQPTDGQKGGGERRRRSFGNGLAVSLHAATVALPNCLSQAAGSALSAAPLLEAGRRASLLRAASRSESGGKGDKVEGWEYTDML